MSVMSTSAAGATHGIALFSDIVRQEVGGRERDYFLLEYADGDKLFAD